MTRSVGRRSVVGRSSHLAASDDRGTRATASVAFAFVRARSTMSSSWETTYAAETTRHRRPAGANGSAPPWFSLARRGSNGGDAVAIDVFSRGGVRGGARDGTRWGDDGDGGGGSHNRGRDNGVKLANRTEGRCRWRWSAPRNVGERGDDAVAQIEALREAAKRVEEEETRRRRRRRRRAKRARARGERHAREWTRAGGRDSGGRARGGRRGGGLWHRDDAAVALLRLGGELCRFEHDYCCAARRGYGVDGGGGGGG